MDDEFTSRDLTIYFAGDNESDALEGMPFDEFDSAEDFRDANCLAHVYSFTATIDRDSAEIVTRG